MVLETWHELRRQLEMIREKQKFYQKESEKITAKSVLLLDEETLIKQQIIKETQMLSVSPFEVILYRDKINLVAAKEKFEEVTDLITKGGDNGLKMPDEIRIWFEDGEISISFYDQSKIEQFVREHGIKLDIKTFLKSKAELERRLEEVSAIVSKFKSFQAETDNKGEYLM